MSLTRTKRQGDILQTMGPLKLRTGTTSIVLVSVEYSGRMSVSLALNGTVLVGTSLLAGRQGLGRGLEG